MEERLQKYLAEAGIASRRKCEEFIKQGRVKVNGITATLGTKVNSETDTVEFDSKVIKKTNTAHTYILLNKPIDYVTTAKDQFNRPTVLDLVKTNKRLVPVGRLDMYTSGALILTDDGDFIYKITHPKHEITKTYTVTIKGIVSKEDVKKLENGVDIGDFVTSPAKVKILKTDTEFNKSRLEITIHEGKNRQIRRMCEAIDKKVLAAGKSVVKAGPHEKVGVFCKRNGKPSVVEYSEISEEMAEATNKNGGLIYGESHILCNLFSVKAIEEISKNTLPYHSAFKKAKYLDKDGNLITSDKPNAYKFEAFLFDAFESLDDMAILRVKREEEFAPVKNAEGVDSPETARKLYKEFHKIK